MKSDGMARLLSEILDPQIESGKYGAIDKDRVRESLTNGPELTDREQCLLLLSPVAREDFKDVRNEILEEVYARIQQQDIDMNMLPLAAAGEAKDKVILRGSGFSVTLYRRDELGIPWIILVQLGASYQKAVNPMTTLRLVDTGGLEWLRGRPDVNGEFTGPWNDAETDLLIRAHRFSLILEPV